MIDTFKKIKKIKIRREINFYYAGLKMQDALYLVWGGLKLLFSSGELKKEAWARKFEEMIIKMTGARLARTFGSARSGLYVLLKAMGIGEGDEVMITGFTCVAVPNPILYLGARPVYVDIDKTTLNMDMGTIEGHINKRTRAIIVQHTLGSPADIDRIVEIARKYDIYVIEDCCQALGSKYKDKPLGVIGDAALLSLELSKTINIGWGGVVWVNNAALMGRFEESYKNICTLSRKEAVRRAFQVALSYFLYNPLFYFMGKVFLSGLYGKGLFRHSTQANEKKAKITQDFLYLMPDVHWLIAGNQFKRLEKMVNKGRKAASLYYRTLKEQGIHNYIDNDHNRGSINWIRYPFLVRDRARMVKYFKARGIQIGNWMDGVISPKVDEQIYKYVPGTCPNAEYVARHIVNLPVHMRLNKRDINKICAALGSYIQENPDELAFAEKLKSSL